MDRTRLAPWLATHIAPHATALDADPAALARALDAAAAAGLLGLKRPGGLDAPASFAASVDIAAASCTFAFLQTQHQGAVGFLAQATGSGRRWLDPLISGAVRCGIAYAFLRRAGPPLVTATPEPGGLRVRGHVPWMTGWTFFSHCVTAAVRPSGDVSFVLHALDGPGVRPSSPMPLVAFEAARTVSLDLDLHVPQDDVLFTVPTDWLARRDGGAEVRQAAFPLGTAAAGARLVREAIAAGRAPDGGTAVALDSAVATTCAEARACLADPSDVTRNLAARAAAVTLAGRAAHAAVSAWSGAANTADHPAGRVWREALGFTVLAQSPSVQAATLTALAPDRDEP